MRRERIFPLNLPWEVQLGDGNFYLKKRKEMFKIAW